MKHMLLLLGKTKGEFIAEGVKEYVSRLNHYTHFTIKLLQERKKVKGKSNIEKQGKLLLHAISPGSFVIVLDAKGKQFTSEDFSRKIAQLEMQGIKEIYYLIGGPDGHSPQVIQKADLLLSFSKMTFTHDMIRMLLVEQLYRAYTIKAGEQYHK